MSDDKIDRPNFGDKPMTIDRREPICMHKFVTVRRHSRTVWCRVCKQEIDPFEVVIDMAGDWDMATWREEERAKLEASVAELKREETQVKARIRNARKNGEQASQAEIYFNELLRRLNEATSMGQIYDAARWSAGFKWLTPDQQRVIDDAGFRAKQRAEASARHGGRRSPVRVIKGGKGGAS